MSNNLVSQPLSVPNNQMDPVPSKLEVSIPGMQMGMMGGISGCPTPQQFDMSNKQIGSVDSMSNNMGLHNSPVLNRQIGQMEGSQLYLMPNQQIGDMEGMWNNRGSQKISLPSKRRTMEEPTFINSAGQQLSVPNKNVAQIETFTNTPGLQQLASWPNKRTIQVHSKSATPGSQNLPAQNKKMVRNESLSGRSGTKQLQTPKNRTTQMEPSPKAKSDSCESVRSKMRESLASALALVTQGQDKASNEECNSDNGVAMTLQQTQGNPQQPESASVIADAADHVSENPTDTLPSKGPSSVDKTDDVRSTSHGIFTNESAGDSPQSWKVGQEVQCDTVFPNEDVSFTDSFFVKDELLQGNGLTWAWDLDVDMGETKEEHTSKKPKLANEDAGGEGRDQAVQSPQSVAFKIESELFKLFGGVNKKYRERGRSLLFNLKDRNNPELRERVMSGEIPPARLCSMTAEELASKELSQWRIAKAEELAQMVVLPDSDVDIRRLVKKTHKGEFQVEFEQDDGVQVEVSVGTSLLTRGQSKNEDTDAHPPATADEIKDKETDVGEKGSLENQDPSYSLTIPSDGTDLMQGLMVDEFKDADFLPPIVSLDEFMESLDAEPPFENLPVDGIRTISPSSKESSEGGNEITASEVASKEPVDTTPEKSDKVEVKHADSAMKTASKEVKSNETKSRETAIEPKPSPPGAASKGDYVWEGILQLNVSTLVTVVGLFRSGEKISTKDWPSSLEIKGRVRLDPFEKFVQGLPMSRSRAVMIVHFALKEGSSEIDHARLGEVTNSYVSDEKLGFAEAAPGVEIYFCPPHPKIVGILTKNLTKHHSENLISPMENGLIGVIVWRRPHLSSSSAISPNSNTNSSPHQKPSSKRHHHHHHHQFPSRKHPEKDVKVNFPSKQTRPGDDDDDDDDIPPGFGPAAAPRDEDDLPEFNFSGASNLPPPPNPSVRIPSRGSNPAAPSRPVDHIRELIQKYGQSGNDVDSRNNVGGIGIQPWNDDDDDDIPEWQPQAPPRQHLLPPQLPVYQTPVPPQFEAARAMALARQQLPVVQVGTPAAALPLQPPLVGMVQGGGGTRWAQPPGPQDQRPSGLGSQPRPLYGVRAGPTADMDRRRHSGGRK